LADNVAIVARSLPPHKSKFRQKGLGRFCTCGKKGGGLA